MTVGGAGIEEGTLAVVLDEQYLENDIVEVTLDYRSGLIQRGPPGSALTLPRIYASIKCRNFRNWG